jgi:glycosyltransferase involved in cell wall biosynthesis
MEFSSEDLKKLPIVMTSMSRWDGDFSSASWSLAKTFSKEQTVIYVDYPYTLIDFIRERKINSVRKRKTALLWGKKSLRPLPEFGTKLYALTPPLMLPVNWLPAGRFYNFLASLNDKRLVKSIQKALRTFGYADFIFFNSFNPLYLSAAPDEATVYVYQSRDNIRALEPYLRKHGTDSEIKAIRKAHLSLATSRQLQRDLTERSGKKVAYFPNAADFGLFRKAFEEPIDVPEDLKNIPTPIIGYAGNICHRLDYQLIQSICQYHNDKSIVLVGPRNHWGHTGIDLDQIPNLYFIGPKSIYELPSFLAHFDILILPFRCNEVTKSIYPLKINEYLASGKPVVATPFSEDILLFKNHIRLEKNEESFNDAIIEEIKNNTEEKARARYNLASQNTWEHRVQQFWELLFQTFSL